MYVTLSLVKIEPNITSIIFNHDKYNFQNQERNQQKEHPEISTFHTYEMTLNRPGSQ